MTAGLPELLPARGQRWLIVVPHPDDETLATGILCQRIVAAGAALTLALATRGDNNPWPQRWIERRWRIDATARRRWGERRLGEWRRALTALGIDRAARTLELGFVDGEIAERLIAEPERSVAALEEAIRICDPTDVVAPWHDDPHPDHSALAVIAALALARRAPRARCLTFGVHRLLPHAAFALAARGDEVRRKYAALDAHASQLALSRARFMALAAHRERFAESDLGASTAAPSIAVAARGEALEIGVAPGVSRARMGAIALVGRVGTGKICSARTGLSLDGSAKLVGREAEQLATADPLFAKLEPRQRGLSIFDRRGWVTVARSDKEGGDGSRTGGRDTRAQ